MPSGPPELHAKFGDDDNAIAQLRAVGYRYSGDGRFLLPIGRTEEYPCESEALDYLWQEWDVETLNYIVPLLPGR